MPGLDASATGNVLRALQMIIGQAGAKERAYGGAIQQGLGGLVQGIAKRDAWDQQDAQQERAHQQAQEMQRRGFDFQRGLTKDARHERNVLRGQENLQRIEGNRAMFSGLGLDAPEGVGSMDTAAARALLSAMEGKRQQAADAAAVRTAVAPIPEQKMVFPSIMGSEPVFGTVERMPSVTEAYSRMPDDASAGALRAAAEALSADRNFGLAGRRVDLQREGMAADAARDEVRRADAQRRWAAEQDQKNRFHEDSMGIRREGMEATTARATASQQDKQLSRAIGLAEEARDLLQRYSDMQREFLSGGGDTIPPPPAELKRVREDAAIQMERANRLAEDMGQDAPFLQFRHQMSPEEKAVVDRVLGPKDAPAGPDFSGLSDEEILQGLGIGR